MTNRDDDDAGNAQPCLNQLSITSRARARARTLARARAPAPASDSDSDSDSGTSPSSVSAQATRVSGDLRNIEVGKQNHRGVDLEGFGEHERSLTTKLSRPCFQR